jgi:hypothetical protein
MPPVYQRCKQSGVAAAGCCERLGKDAAASLGVSAAAARLSAMGDKDMP